MTNWLPDIKTGDGPLYARLAGRIENAIETGDLPSGAKLPPQRNLAFDLGVKPYIASNDLTSITD